ncbi:MAG: polyhydroxyalkanoate synthesis repressor PhaR [Alphaproteobacteria bacterium]|nr:polyhydroxyalkanoate synthesis repressor PhaR [Alphaproteobacteria bacterium]
MSASRNETVVIKKYANRRLYNTATSTYVTLDNLAQMVKEGTEFNVYDAKTNEDLTRAVLTQIIVEEEGKSGQNLLPISFMRRLIGFYGDNMQWLVPKYLEHSMQSLSKNQEQIRDYFQSALGGMFPFGTTLEQMSKQNIAMFERTMQMFSPFAMPKPSADAPSAGGFVNAEKVEDTSEKADPAPTKEDLQEKAEEAAFTPSIKSGPAKKGPTAIPTPETTKAAAAQAPVTGDEVQNKIAALQRQLSDLAKNKA